MSRMLQNRCIRQTRFSMWNSRKRYRWARIRHYSRVFVAEAMMIICACQKPEACKVAHEGAKSVFRNLSKTRCVYSRASSLRNFHVSRCSMHLVSLARRRALKNYYRRLPSYRKNHIAPTASQVGQNVLTISRKNSPIISRSIDLFINCINNCFSTWLITLQALTIFQQEVSRSSRHW